MNINQAVGQDLMRPIVSIPWYGDGGWEEQSEAELDRLWACRHAFLYKAQLSALYHQKRERFFESADKVGKFIAVIGGSAALSKAVDPTLVPVILAVVTVWSAASLVFSPSDRARRHAEIASKWRMFEGRILAKGEHDFKDDDLKAWGEDAAKLEAAEPPALGALVIQCQNELAIAAGQPTKVLRLHWWEKLLMEFFDLLPSEKRLISVQQSAQ